MPVFKASAAELSELVPYTGIACALDSDWASWDRRSRLTMHVTGYIKLYYSVLVSRPNASTSLNHSLIRHHLSGEPSGSTEYSTNPRIKF